MSPEVVERAKRLMRSLPVRPQPADPVKRLLQEFEQTHVERSRVWLIIVVRLVAIMTLAAVSAGMIYFALRALGVISRPVAQQIGDARIHRDYRDHPATDVSALDPKNLVITTRGGGAHHLRTDGGRIGIWETFDPERTSGRLPDPNLIQVHDDGERLYFVGQSGSLSSCQRGFRDWKLHFGGGGFAGDIDLAAELTALAISPDRSLFVVGTNHHGTGVYDITSRQWRRLSPEQPVHALLITASSIWVGTETGLRVFSYDRQGEHVKLTAEPWRELPPDFRGRPVRALQLAGEGRDASVECVVGRGAHLTAPVKGGAWRTLVDEGEATLAGMSGSAELHSLLAVNGGAYLALPGYGPGFYESAGRRLKLVGGGLKWPRLLTSPNPGAEKPSIYLVAGPTTREDRSGLYQLTDKGWQLIGDSGDNVTGLTFVGGQPLVKLDHGLARLFQSSGGKASFFASAPLKTASGPADVGGGRLVVSGEGGEVQIYLPAIRGWKQLPPTGKEPIRQLRAGDNFIGVVKENGEAGYFASEQYLPVFRSSALPLQPEKTISATTFNDEFWFIRHGQPYVYNPASSSIRAMGDQLGKDFTPQQIRSTNRYAYLLGTEKESRRIYQTSGQGWSAFDSSGFGSDGVDQIVTVPDGLLIRKATGEVLVSADSGQNRIFFEGKAALRWRRLAPDRFGKVLGLTQTGSLKAYDTATGKWSEPMGSQAYANLLLHQISTDQDRLYLASSNGVQLLDIKGSEIKAGNAFFPGQSIIQLGLSGERLWVLTGVQGQDSANRTIWTCNLDGSDPSKILDPGGPEAPTTEQWQKSSWTTFVEGQFWWVTSGGDLWRYSLEVPAWRRSSLNVTAPTRLRVADGGILWWMDESGNLYSQDPDSGIRLDLGRKQFSLSEIRSLVEMIKQARVGLVELALGLLLLAFLIPAVKAAWRYVRSRVSQYYSLRRKQSHRRDQAPAKAGPHVWWHSRLLMAAGVVAACCLLSLIVPWLLVAWMIDPLVPFESARFANRVQDYWLEDSQLVVSTEEGLWSFKRAGTQITPSRFEPGTKRAASREESVYPLTDRSGFWQVRRPGSRFSLWHNDGGVWNEVECGRYGWVRDQLLSIAVSADRLITVTPAGLAEYQLNGRRSHFYPLAGNAVGVLVQIGDQVWHVDPSGRSHRYLGPAGARWEAASNWPRDMQAHGVRWRRGPEGDELDQRDFDAASGRFRDDVSVRLVRDDQGKPWIKTWGHWRGVEITKDGVRLSKAAAAPTPAPPTRPWRINDHWEARLTETDAGDAVSFVFTPSDLRVEDPFGDRGRWPDEDVQSVLVEGATVWFGTAYGLRHVGSEEIDLPGKRISALVRRNDQLYARAEDGGYVRHGQSWNPVPAVPPDLFASPRPLALNIGSGVTITATERIVDGHLRTELARFDPPEGRFLIDKIRAIEGDAQGCWILTPGGMQRLGIENELITTHTAHLTGEQIVSLRRDVKGQLCAAGAGETRWRFLESGGWQPLAVNDPDTPFSIRRERLSDVVFWEKHYAREGDTWRLTTTAGPLTFEEGKLASDYVTSVATGVGQRAEVTRAGIVRQGQVITLPGPDVRVMFDRGQLVARLTDGTYGYDESSRQWQSRPTSVLDAPIMKFDGLTWMAGSVSAMKPTVVWVESGNNSRPLRLTERGQFPFDNMQAVASRPGEVWLAHSGGVTTHRAADFSPLRIVDASALSRSGDEQNTRLISVESQRVWLMVNGDGVVSEGGAGFRALEPSERERLGELHKPRWSGQLGTAPAHATLTSANGLALERDGEEPSLTPLPAAIKAIAGAGDFLWALSERGLYRLDTCLIPHGARKKPSTTLPATLPSPEAALAVLWFDFGKAELTPKAKEQIPNIVQRLNGPDSRAMVWIDGHADRIGSEALKKDLSYRRAKSVYAALIAGGVAQERLEIRKFGDSRPFLGNERDDAKDRRVEVHLQK